MKQNRLKYLIDTVIFIDLCSITVIGLFLGFVIPKGGAADKYFLGLHRHEWGDLHLYLSLFFILLLMVHLWFNRAWIINSTKRYFGAKWKEAFWFFCFGWVVVLFTGWIVVQLV